MKKLLQKIEEIKKNQNSSSMSFDFLKKDKTVENVVNNPVKSRFKKIFTFFVVSQIMFGLANISNFANYVTLRQIDSKNIHNEYTKFQELMRTGKNQESIIAFIKIVNSKEQVNDLLAGGTVLALLTKDEFKSDITLTEEQKKLEEEYRIKLSPETINTIVGIYKENWKNGITREKEDFNNYRCMIIDLSCVMLKKLYENTFMKTNHIIENKVNITNYHIEHLNEYKKWRYDTQKRFEKNKNLSENDKLPMLDSPGHVAFPYNTK